jgi:hypothetical protein
MKVRHGWKAGIRTGFLRELRGHPGSTARGANTWYLQRSLWVDVPTHDSGGSCQ